MDEKLRVPSITGVDIELDIAGPGGRSYAYVIDWHIRALLSAAWLLVGSLIFAGALTILTPGDDAFPAYAGVVLLPTAALYLLYHPILEVLMKGRTPGKRMAGIRIVTTEGTTPDTGAILIRNVFRLIDSLPTLYGVGLATTMFTRRAVRIGDLAAGTLLVYEDPPRHDKPVSDVSDAAVTKLGLARAELVRDLLDRWDELAPAASANLARQLLASHTAAPLDTANATDLRKRLEALLH